MTVTTIQQLLDWLNDQISAQSFSPNAEVYIASYFQNKKNYHFNQFQISGPKPHFLYIPQDNNKNTPPKLCLGKFANNSNQLPSS